MFGTLILLTTSYLSPSLKVTGCDRLQSTDEQVQLLGANTVDNPSQVCYTLNGVAQ